MQTKSEFSKNILTLITGTTIAQAIPIAISPILTRLYTPQEFGVFALFIAVVALLSPISSARYEQAILLQKDDENAVALFFLSLSILSIFSIILFSIIYIFHNRLPAVFNSNEIILWLYLAPFTVFFIGLFNILTYLNNRKKLYTQMTKSIIYKAVALAITQIVLGIFKGGAGGLIIGHFFAQTAANTQLFKKVLSWNLCKQSVKIDKISNLAKKYNKFPKYQLPHVFFNSASSNLPIYIFSIFFSSVVVGFYSLSIRIVLSPLMIISSSAGKVYNEKVVKLIHQKEPVYKFTKKFLFDLSKKILPLLLIIVLFAPEIFSFIFSRQWTQAGIYTRILSPWLFLNIIVSSISYLPSVLDKQDKAFYVSIAQLISSVIAIYVGVFFNSIHIALFSFMLSNSTILIYNLSWILQELKSMDKIVP